jgi:thymidylate kinase
MRLRPSIVAFSGLDGSGKSSQAELLRRTLEAQGIDAEVAWVPVAINESLARIKSIVRALLSRLPGWRGRVYAPPPPDATRTHGVVADEAKELVTRSSAARQLWSTFVVLTNVLGHWRELLRHRRCDVVIFDRYALDTAVRIHTWYGDRGNVGFQVWLARALSPRPLRAYLLDVPAATAHERKDDGWTLGELAAQADLYRRELARFGASLLDGERPTEELAGAVRTQVLARLDRRP